MNNKVHNFRELKTWKLSMDLAESVYLITKQLPNEEKFGLTSQIQRCAISIPSNIAEGSGMETKNHFIHFLNICLGSSYQLETQLILLNSLYQIKTDEISQKVALTQKMVGGFKRSL